MIKSGGKKENVSVTVGHEAAREILNPDNIVEIQRYKCSLMGYP